MGKSRPFVSQEKHIRIWMCSKIYLQANDFHGIIPPGFKYPFQVLCVDASKEEKNFVINLFLKTWLNKRVMYSDCDKNLKGLRLSSSK